MADDDVRYAFVASFDIDTGELAALSREECFVLGVEWHRVWEQLKLGTEFMETIHAANRERIHRLCFRLKRVVVVTDAGSGYNTIEVGAGVKGYFRAVYEHRRDRP